MMPALALAEGLKALGLEVSATAQTQLLDYIALIEKWNNVYNLTAIRARERMVSEHLLDSLAVARHIPPGALLDLGSGAGLPGIPLRVVRPDLRVTVLESNHKKCAFLKQATIELALSEVEVICQRAETFRPPSGFDSVISRAVADLATLASLSLPLLAPGGRLFAMKGVEPRDELAAIGATVRVEAVIRLDVPGLKAQRHLVVMTKA